jgi:hypothetical protein
MHRKHSKTSAARVGRSRRAAQALELRKGGLTFRQIGERMGFSEQRAHRLVTEELQRLNADRAEAAAEVTRLECERLDALLAAVWPEAQGGNLSAIDRVLAILARRAKMLGIDGEQAAGTVVTQSVTVEMSEEDRREAIRQVLLAAGFKELGESAPAGDLTAAGLEVPAEAAPGPSLNGATSRLPYGPRELPPGDNGSQGDDVRPLF